MSFSILSLFTPETATKIFDIGISIAKTVGLPVTSWRTGDPTRSIYKYVATKLAAVDQTVANLARSAVLSVLVQAANGGDAGALAWLKVVALEQFGIEVQEATYATSAAGFGALLTNTGGGNYPIEVGGVTLKSSVTGKTYHNTNAGTLAPGPGTTITLEFIADEAGSDSTVAANEIDELVTTMLGVVVTSSAAAIGLDEESPDSVYQRCQDSLGALSPDGPRDAYRYVSVTSKLTGIETITRAIAVPTPGENLVTVYIAGATGSAAGPDVTAVQAAVDRWATPLTVTATVVSAVGVAINTDANVTYAGALSDDDLEAEIANAIGVALARIPIGGVALPSADSGVPVGAIWAAIMGIDGVTACALTTPAGDTVLAANEVPIPGTVSITVV